MLGVISPADRESSHLAREPGPWAGAAPFREAVSPARRSPESRRHLHEIAGAYEYFTALNDISGRIIPAKIEMINQSHLARPWAGAGTSLTNRPRALLAV